ncbi:transcription factor TAFII-31, partial [Wallemia mellicola CBS 633.66]
MSDVKPVPRTAHLISLILASKGINDAPPATIHMLLDFANRYTHEVLSDSLVYSEYAGRNGYNGVELGDVEMAISVKANHQFSLAPPKEYLLELSQTLNSRPLPPLPESYGPRMPAPRHRLTAPNFSLI